MDTITLVGLAVALAMDAFAVSIAVGISLKQISYRQFFRLSWHFGLFQALMPLAGWGLGYSIRHFVTSFAHWIAFALLIYVGFNMIRGSLSGEDEEGKKGDPTRGISLMVLSIATSIDAFAVGVSLSLLNISIILPSIIIGIVALIFTLIGLNLGKMAASFSKISPIAEFLGGIVLWGIGFNILIQNNVFERLF